MVASLAGQGSQARFLHTTSESVPSGWPTRRPMGATVGGIVVMFLLKAQMELLGLKAPAFSWMVALGLILLTIVIVLRYQRMCWTRRVAFNTALERLNQLRTGEQTTSGAMSVRLYDALDRIFSSSPVLSSGWQDISSYTVKKTDKNGDEVVWTTRPVNEILAYDTVINTHSYRTAPTIISGIGLLATFLAILVALMDVRFMDNRIQGLDLLVQGLSGKFLSSVVALSCATFLLATESILFSPLRRSFNNLAAAITLALPQLTQAQILSDLQDDMRQRSDRFETFFTRLPQQIVAGLSAATDPLFDRMTVVVENLSSILKTEQERSRESTNEQLKALLLNFDGSLRASLEGLALRFNDTLTNSTKGQFDEVAASLSGSGLLLEQMNTQFLQNQNVLRDLIDLARNTTTEQMAIGHSQVEQLTAVLAGLMVKLEEKTGESIGSMEQTMSAVTANISDKVGDLTAHMAAKVQESTESSTRGAKLLLEEAGALNARTALQLAQLLEKHSTELTKVDELKCLLESTLREFTGSLSSYSQVTQGLQKLAVEVNGTMASLHEIAKLVTESQETAARVSLSASDNLESARLFSLTQREVWSGIQESMVHYESLFQRVEGHAKELLTQIGLHLGNYSDSTQKHFTQLTSAANNFIAEATGRLAGSVDELGEQLDELQTSVAGIVQISKTMVRHAAA
jgi:hypothetical protein